MRDYRGGAFCFRFLLAGLLRRLERVAFLRGFSRRWPVRMKSLGAGSAILQPDAPVPSKLIASGAAPILGTGNPQPPPVTYGLASAQRQDETRRIPASPVKKADYNNISTTQAAMIRNLVRKLARS